MRTLALLCLIMIAAPLQILALAKKKKKEVITQTLEAPKDPPAAIVADTQRLVFMVTPLSAKGLLSAQMRDAFKDLIKQAKGAQIVKLRAFTAGTGDMRRVLAIVSDICTDKKLPLPAISVVQVGGLPLEGAQVQLEAYVVGKKVVNPEGLAFVSGVGIATKNPLDPVPPLLDQAMADLKAAVEASGSTSQDVLRVTCLFSSLDQYPKLHSTMQTAFPSAAIAAVMTQRGPTAGLAECEGVARLKSPVGEPLKFLSPASMNPSPNYSKIALVGSPKIVLSGTQMAFNYQDSDVRLAFSRLNKSLEAVQSSLKLVAFSHLYPLSNAMLAKIRNIRFEFYDKTRPPASTMVLFEGLPSMDASFGIDVVAVPRQ
jgi:enamine deaminase RidA (YjgF/YER057c/UK114 family)